MVLGKITKKTGLSNLKNDLYGKSGFLSLIIRKSILEELRINSDDHDPKNQ